MPAPFSEAELAHTEPLASFASERLVQVQVHVELLPAIQKWEEGRRLELAVALGLVEQDMAVVPEQEPDILVWEAVGRDNKYIPVEASVQGKQEVLLVLRRRVGHCELGSGLVDRWRGLLEGGWGCREVVCRRMQEAVPFCGMA